MRLEILTSTIAFHIPYLILPNSATKSFPRGMTVGYESVG